MEQWIYKIIDKEFKVLEKSEQIKNWCKDNHVPYIDISDNEEDAILDPIEMLRKS